MKASRVLGIMSGTSLDGVDYALCSIGPGRLQLLNLRHTGYPRRLRQRLLDAAEGRGSGHELAQLHHDLGRFYARHAASASSNRHGRPALIGLHGQTVFHQPNPRRPATLQLGEPAYLAAAMDVPVVSNFRPADMAAGGQGAPLATKFHEQVFAERGSHVGVVNLGGICNITSIDWRRGRQPAVLAFDTGPANMLLDRAAVHFSGGRAAMDRNGAWALAGTPSEGLLRGWLKDAYFHRRPPKSTGREAFGEAYFQRVLGQMRRLGLGRDDALATLTALTARSLAINLEKHLPSVPDRIVLTGGGAANPALASGLGAALSDGAAGVEIETSEAAGWPWQAVEPAAFALLAWLRWHGKPGNLPGTTGARQAVLLGQITELAGTPSRSGLGS